MPISEYEFEYLGPDDTEPTPAETHPDPETAARLYQLVRSTPTRRFALATPDGAPTYNRTWYGLRHRCGRVTMWQPGGELIGDYRSIDSARARLDPHGDSWLVWLEAHPRLPIDTTATASKAKLELKNRPETWVLTMAFTAHGDAGARRLARQVAETAADFLPGHEHDTICVARESNPGVLVPIYCDRDATCVREPRHSGNCRADGEGGA